MALPRFANSCLKLVCVCALQPIYSGLAAAGGCPCAVKPAML